MSKEANAGAKSAIAEAPHDHEHWRAWEDAALITMLSERDEAAGGDGGTLEAVAERLGRTLGAVSERYDDLVAGRREPPEGYQERLRRLRARLHIAPGPQTPLVIIGPGGDYARPRGDGVAWIGQLERIVAALKLEVPARPKKQDDRPQKEATGHRPQEAEKQKRRRKGREVAALEAEACGLKSEDSFLCNRDCHGCSIGCATPGDRHDRMKIAIRTGKKPEALPAIERCADVQFLRDAELAGLRGDWRRAAVAKQIAKLEETTGHRPQTTGSGA